MTRSAGLVTNGQRESRTPDTRIFSPVLYQLSYLPGQGSTYARIEQKAGNVNSLVNQSGVD